MPEILEIQVIRGIDKVNTKERIRYYKIIERINADKEFAKRLGIIDLTTFKGILVSDKKQKARKQ